MSPRRRLLVVFDAIRSAARPAAAVALAGALVLPMSSGCRGPEPRPRTVKLKLDADLVARDWDGPRRDAVEQLVRRQGRDFARSLFDVQPMPDGVPAEEAQAVRTGRKLLAMVEGEVARTRHETPPDWWKGAKAAPQGYEHDLPREHLIEIQRGETLALLGRWSGRDMEQIRDDNRDVLKRRKWLRVGMNLRITMSANQKMAFDQARERFQSNRLEEYFSKRYIEKVVVYVVQRGDVISTVAKRYGDAPIWLLEEFNQADFTGLQPGDTILIPTVRAMTRGRRAPPRLQVVDMDGRPLSTDEEASLGKRLRRDLLGRARLAIDDSNVFERDDDNPRAVRTDNLLPRPAPRPVAVAAGPPVGLGVAPHGGVLAPAPVRVAMREVIVKPGETVSHYSAWSGLSVEEVRAANTHLDPKSLRVGQRLGLPLTDLGYADFVLARAGVRRPGPKASAVVAASGGAVLPSSAAHSPPAHKPTPVPGIVPTPRQLTARIAPAPPVHGAVTPAAAPASAPAPAPAAVRATHVVQPGETGLGIALKYKLSLAALRRVNPGRNLDRIYVGDRLAIPAK